MKESLPRPHDASDSPVRTRIYMAVGVAGALVVIATVLLFLLGFLQTKQSSSDTIRWPVGTQSPSGRGGTPSGTLAVRYLNELNDEVTGGIANSPLQVQIRVPQIADHPQAMPISVSAQLMDSSGKPALFGGQPGSPVALNPSYDAGAWAYYGSVPGNPGSYYTHVELHWHPADVPTPTLQTVITDILQPAFQARPENGPPLTSGYVFAAGSDLWMLSSDAVRQRRVTFLATADTYVEAPIWSPDGKQIVFTYYPQQDPNQLPATEIWSVQPGSSPRRLIAHKQDESLYDPKFSLDGKYLYFTAESLSGEPLAYDSMGNPVDAREIDRLDLATGARTQWKKQARMASPGGPSGDVLYLEDALPPAGSDQSTSSRDRLVRVSSDGSNRKVLVDSEDYPTMYAPSMSPDGKWVVFAASNINRQSYRQQSAFDILDWLLFKPEVAEAHGVPWDLYMVPSDGGNVTRWTQLQEDQPVSVWLDNNTLVFMGTSGLYHLTIGPDGKATADPVKVHPGASHGGLTWHAP